MGIPPRELNTEESESLIGPSLSSEAMAVVSQDPALAISVCECTAECCQQSCLQPFLIKSAVVFSKTKRCQGNKLRQFNSK